MRSSRPGRGRAPGASCRPRCGSRAPRSAAAGCAGSRAASRSGVHLARPLEPLHLLEGVDALDEVLAEHRREGRDHVVECGELPRQLGDGRARHAVGEVRRSQRRREHAPDGRPALRGPVVSRTRTTPAARAEGDPGAAGEAPVEVDPPGADHLHTDPAGRVAPGSRPVAAALRRPRCRRAGRPAAARSAPSPRASGLRAIGRGRGPGGHAAPGSVAPVGRSVVEATTCHRGRGGRARLASRGSSGRRSRSCAGTASPSAP